MLAVAATKRQNSWKIPVKELFGTIMSWAPATFLEMNFFTVIFQGFYLDYNLALFEFPKLGAGIFELHLPVDASNGLQIFKRDYFWGERHTAICKHIIDLLTKKQLFEGVL